MRTVLVGLALAALAARPAAQTTARTVTMSVLVKNGNVPVRDLAPGDFEILDNGVRQTVSAAHLDVRPTDVTVLLDVNTSVPKAMDEFAQLAQSFSRPLGLRDRLRLMTFGDAVALTLPMQWSREPMEFRALAPPGRVSLDAAVLYALVSPRAPDRRGLIVVYTDGVDVSNVLEPAQLSGAAAHANDTLHVMLTPDWRSARLRTVARATGGEIHRQTGEPAGAFDELWTEFRSSYVVEWLPQGVARDGWHNVTVRVPAFGKYTVHARPGYRGR